MANDLFIRLDQPKTWEPEIPSKWTIGNDEEQTIIPDARFRANGEMYFVEVDHKQTMKKNIEKIKKYEEFSKVVRQELKYTPTVICYTLTDNRKEKLKAACEKHNVKYKIFL